MKFLTALSLIASVYCSTSLAETLVIGTYPAKIAPEQMMILALPSKGLVTNITPQEQRCKKGDIIARLDKKELKREKEQLEIAIRKDIVTRKDQIRSLEQDKRKLEFYLNLSPEEQSFETEIHNNKLIDAKEASLDIEERLDIARLELESAPENMREDFNDKFESHNLEMPFDGSIRHLVTIPESNKEQFESFKAQPFATAYDDSHFYILLSITQSQHSQLPPEDFHVKVKLPAGKSLKGTFNKRLVQGAGQNDSLVYYFILDKKDNQTAFDMLGTTSRAELIYSIPAEAKSIDKSSLSLHPDAADCENWEELIEKIYPQHHLLIEADESILIIPASTEL